MKKIKVNVLNNLAIIWFASQVISCEDKGKDSSLPEDKTDLSLGDDSELSPSGDRSFTIEGKKISSDNFRRDFFEYILDEKLSKKAVINELGEPSINAIDFFIYKFWDPAELRNAGRKGIIGFNIYFNNGNASRISVTSSG